MDRGAFQVLLLIMDRVTIWRTTSFEKIITLSGTTVIAFTRFICFLPPLTRRPIPPFGSSLDCTHRVLVIKKPRDDVILAAFTELVLWLTKSYQDMIILVEPTVMASDTATILADPAVGKDRVKIIFDPLPIHSINYCVCT